MPVTKKQGAIFAIYADSPGQLNGEGSPVTRSKSSSSATTQLSPTKPTKTGNVGTVSRAVLGQKPLARIQATSKATMMNGEGSSVKEPISFNPMFMKTCQSTKLTSSQPIKSKVTKSTGISTNDKPVKSTSTTKRQFEIYSDSPKPKAATATTSLDSNPSTIRPKAIRTLSETSSALSPIKKTKVTPPKTKSHNHSPSEDKENIPDSPASRTRSKVLLSSVNIMKDGGLKVFEKEGKEVRGRKGDMVLCDVSEVYGASGEIPEGFKTQGIKSTRRALSVKS